MTFTQNFTAVANSLGWTALVATVPILYFFWALAIKKMKGYMAGLTTLILAILVAVIAFSVPITVMEGITGIPAIEISSLKRL